MRRNRSARNYFFVLPGYCVFCYTVEAHIRLHIHEMFWIVEIVVEIRQGRKRVISFHCFHIRDIFWQIRVALHTIRLKRLINLQIHECVFATSPFLKFGSNDVALRMISSFATHISYSRVCSIQFSMSYSTAERLGAFFEGAFGF